MKNLLVIAVLIMLGVQLSFAGTCEMQQQDETEGTRIIREVR